MEGEKTYSYSRGTYSLHFTSRTPKRDHIYMFLLTYYYKSAARSGVLSRERRERGCSQQ
jgi:hypothetical protein